jgi:Raf kinase inhibitor-like YbhB/YbcL family protein
MHRAHALLALPALGLALAGCGGGDRQEVPTPDVPDRIAVTSPAFADGATIPRRYSCEGDNISLPLRWTGVPADARELALVFDDPDASGGTFVHWILFKLKPASAGVADGEVPAGARQAQNSTGHRAYAGPCPPPGDDPHHYHVTLYALRAPLSAKDGASADAVLGAVDDAAIARGELVGRFGR